MTSAEVSRDAPPALGDFELRAPTLADREAFLTASNASRAIHRGWVSPATDEASYDDYLQRFEPEAQDTQLIWFRDTLVGIVNMQNIVRGAGQYATLGYMGFSPHVGRGLLRRGVALGVDRAFTDLDLHRVEAGIQPTNTRSIALIASLGFELEGLLKGLVKIDGEWRDHELWATRIEVWATAERLFDA